MQPIVTKKNKFDESSIKSIIFMDIRGYTAFCRSVSFEKTILVKLLDNYYSIAKECFQGEKHFTADEIISLTDEIDINQILHKIDEFRAKFKEVCKAVKADLKIGVSIVRGEVTPIEAENFYSETTYLAKKHYVGDVINLASRLCDEARPEGVIILKESFASQKLSEEYSKRYKDASVKNLKGFEKNLELRCWRENTVRKNTKTKIADTGVEVHVTGLCFFNDKVLLQKRDRNLDLYPGMWSTPGGKVQKGKSFEESLKNIFKKDTGLTICNLKVLDTYYINKYNIPGLTYYCNIAKGRAITKSKKMTSTDFFSNDKLFEMKKENDLVSSCKDIELGYNQNTLSKKLPVNLRVVMTKQCNLNCKYCHEENLFSNVSETNLNGIFKSLDVLGKKVDITKITLTGGEPFLPNIFPQVVEISSYINSWIQTLEPITIVTNGIELTKDYLRQIKNYNVRLKISIYGTDDESFYSYTGIQINNYLEFMKQKLLLVQQFDINYSLHLILTRDFEANFQMILEFIKDKDLKVDKIRLIEMVPPRRNLKLFINDFLKFEQSSLYFQDCEAFYNENNRHCSYQYYKGVTLEFYRNPCEVNDSCKDCFLNWSLIVGPNGELQTCQNAIIDSEISRVVHELGILTRNYKSTLFK